MANNDLDSDEESGSDSDVRRINEEDQLHDAIIASLLEYTGQQRDLG